MSETTVKQLKEWLNRFPDETKVFIAIQEPPSTYASYGSVRFESPKLEDNDIGDGWEYNDWSKNQFIEPEHDLYGEKHLNIGESH